MIPRRAIFHVGMPRTGSTSFQSVLCDIREPLRRAGILYPDLTPRSAAALPHINHQHLGEALDGRRPPVERAELFDRLAEATERHRPDTLLLSYESLALIPGHRRAAQRLVGLVARLGYRPEILLVVRPQIEYLNSTYTHRMQFLREDRLFEDFVRAFVANRRFAYDRVLVPWSAAVEDRVTAVPYRDCRCTEPLLVRMWRALCVDDRVLPLLDADRVSRSANASPGPLAVEIERRLAAVCARARLRLPAREVTRYVENVVSAQGGEKSGFRGADAAIKEWVRRQFNGANDRFARRHWGCCWDEVVAPEPDIPANALRTGAMDEALEQRITAICLDTSRHFGIAARPAPWHAPFKTLTYGLEALAQALQLF